MDRERTDGEDYDYLLISDVHLGSDLVPHLRPWARASWLTEDAEVDGRLGSLLAYYGARPHAGRATCLVIAGDFLELVGVSLSPEGALATRPTSEEQRHGLGSAPDHVVRKIEAIAARHRRVFAALCTFLAAGNKLVVVRGNHDIELHWHAARAALVEAICGHAESPEQAAEVASRIQICPWFFAVEGLLHVEHGHEFDTMCSYGDPLVPTCPRDPRRIRATPFAVMLRQVARPTRGLSTVHYENATFGAYLRLLVRLGLSESLRIAMRFARAVAQLLWESLSYVQPERWVRKLRAHAEERRFAQKMQLSPQQLTELRRLYAAPAARSLIRVLRSLYLDRLAATAFALLFVALGAVVARYDDFLRGALCALAALPLGTFGCLGPNRDLTPALRMRRSAARIARLFGARYVVMGHTHLPELTRLEDGAHYLNLGHWGRDDLPEEAPDGSTSIPSTYLHLTKTAGGYRHQFLRWDTALGAVPFSPGVTTTSDDCRAPAAQSA